MVGVSYYSNDVYGAEMTPKFDVYTQWTYYEFPIYLADIQGKTVGTDGKNTSSLKMQLLRDSSVGADTYYDFANFQLEFGRGATPFEKRSYGEELGLCQRYFWREYGGTYEYSPGPTNGGGTIGQGTHPVTMRVKPTMSNNCSGNPKGASLSGDTTVGVWTWYKQNSGYDSGASSYQTVGNWNYAPTKIGWHGGSYNFRPSDTSGTTALMTGVNTYIQAYADYAWAI